jgi:hypothetical protein
MAELRTVDSSATSASFVLGRKLDSIPFSSHHISIIGVLALVGFIEGYDLVMTGSLLVLAKAPLQLTGSDIRWLAGRLFAGLLAPFLMEPHTGSAPIFFGTIFVVVAIGALVPLVFGRETVGQLETVTEGVPALV